VIGDPASFLFSSLFLIPALLIAIPVHELGHAAAAVLMGDPSPRNRGVFRWGPRAFINPYGVVAVFLLNVGFGNPAPVNEARLQTPLKKLVWVLGGPLASLLLAVVFGLMVRILSRFGVLPDPSTLVQPAMGLVATVLYACYFLNLSIFAFQLLPIPGLDGWRVLEVLLRRRNPSFFYRVSGNTQTIWVVAAMIVLFGPYLLHFSPLAAVMGIFYQPASTAILGGCTGYTLLQPCPLPPL